MHLRNSSALRVFFFSLSSWKTSQCFSSCFMVTAPENTSMWRVRGSPSFLGGPGPWRGLSCSPGRRRPSLRPASDTAPWAPCLLRFLMLLFFSVKNLWFLIVPQDTTQLCSQPLSPLRAARGTRAREGPELCQADTHETPRNLHLIKNWIESLNLKYVFVSISI